MLESTRRPFMELHRNLSSGIERSVRSRKRVSTPLLLEIDEDKLARTIIKYFEVMDLHRPILLGPTILLIEKLFDISQMKMKPESSVISVESENTESKSESEESDSNSKCEDFGSIIGSRDSEMEHEFIKLLFQKTKQNYETDPQLSDEDRQIISRNSIRFIRNGSDAFEIMSLLGDINSIFNPFKYSKKVKEKKKKTE